MCENISQESALMVFNQHPESPQSSDQLRTLLSPPSSLGFLLFICILSYKLFVYAYLYLSLSTVFFFKI